MTTWLVDTGPLVAFFDSSDADHEWVKNQWARAPVPMMTCEPVLAEAAYLLQAYGGMAPHKLMALIERGVLSIPFRVEEHAAALAVLLRRYSDQGMQLADACLVRMSELRRDCCVFTLDKDHFRVYRRFDRRVIPLVTPD